LPEGFEEFGFAGDGFEAAVMSISRRDYESLICVVRRLRNTLSILLPEN
jgi:hypothetical protein